MAQDVVSDTSLDIAGQRNEHAIADDTSQESSPRQSCRQSPSFKFWGIVLCLVTLTLLGGTVLQKPLKLGIEWARGVGWYGGLVYVILFWLSVMVCMPSTMVEIGAGIVYPIPVAILLSSIAKFGGSCCSFLLARRLGHEWVHQTILPSAGTLIRGISLAIEQNPTKMAFLVRAAYVPIGVKNYGVALCTIPFITFAMSALIVGMPYTILWAVAGNSVDKGMGTSAGGSKPGNKVELAVASIGCAILFLTLLLLGWYTHKAIKSVGDEEEPKTPISGYSPAHVVLGASAMSGAVGSNLASETTAKKE